MIIVSLNTKHKITVMSINKFVKALELVLEKKFEGDFKAAVGIVQDGDRWLLGLAKGTGSDRDGTWCHPGGRLKKHEDPTDGAVREVYEETGVRCKAVGKPFIMPDHDHVAFVHCKAIGKPKLDNNHEFSALGFFKYKELKTLILYKNVIQLIDRVRD